MSVSIPLIKTKKREKEIMPPNGEPVSAYDIILGKISIKVESIPYYMLVKKSSFE